MNNKFLNGSWPVILAKSALLFFGLITIILLLFGCSVSKHVQKNDQSSATKTEAQAEEKTKKETESDLTNKTTTTEFLDSLIKVKGLTLSGSTSIKDLKTGKTLLLEDSDQLVKINIDSAGTVQAFASTKPKVIPVMIKKTTVSESRLKQTVKSSSDSTGENKVQTKSEVKTQDRQVTKRFGFPWWLWLLIAAAAYLIWKFWPKIKMLIGL